MLFSLSPQLEFVLEGFYQMSLLMKYSNVLPYHLLISHPQWLDLIKNCYESGIAHEVYNLSLKTPVDLIEI